jgi:hypothetical protein
MEAPMDERLRELMMTFHTLAYRVGRAGTLEDVRAISINASHSTGTRQAAAFILHVAERMPFDRDRAFASWDREQRVAFEAWEAAPWFLSAA